MAIKSKIYEKEHVDNKGRKFGEDTEYFPAILIGKTFRFPLLFTREQIDVARTRAQKQQEDAPDTKKWWEEIL